MGHPPPHSLSQNLTPLVYMCDVYELALHLCECTFLELFFDVCVCFINCKPLSTTRQNNIGLTPNPVYRYGTWKLDTRTNLIRMALISWMLENYLIQLLGS